jgi:hypothetical protein
MCQSSFILRRIQSNGEQCRSAIPVRHRQPESAQHPDWQLSLFPGQVRSRPSWECTFRQCTSNTRCKLLSGLVVPLDFGGESRQLMNYGKTSGNPELAALSGRRRRRRKCRRRREWIGPMQQDSQRRNGNWNCGPPRPHSCAHFADESVSLGRADWASAHRSSSGRCDRYDGTAPIGRAPSESFPRRIPTCRLG